LSVRRGKEEEEKAVCWLPQNPFQLPAYKKMEIPVEYNKPSLQMIQGREERFIASSMPPSACTCTGVCMYIHTYVCMYVYMYACMQVYMYVHTYVCVHTRTHTQGVCMCTHTQPTTQTHKLTLSHTHNLSFSHAISLSRALAFEMGFRLSLLNPIS
jgi:hypothetical protein